MIKDKYTGLEFSSRQKYDAFRRTPEYSKAVEEHYKKYKQEYKCYFCGEVSYSLPELKNHHETYHMDKLIELSQIGLMKRRRGVL